jgi:L-lactate dehydrogenase complex protein LldF
MKVTANNFIPAAHLALMDDEMRASVNQATTTAFQKRLNMMFAAGDEYGEALRQQATRAKRRALSRLPELLEQAEANLTRNGARVLWALDSDEVNRLVLEIIERHAVKSVVKSKSMVSEEVGLNDALEAQGIEVVETDLGEYIIQLAGEHPSHIVTPVIHKSLESIRELFIQKLGMPPTDDAGQMARFARQVLREKFLAADMGVTGGNFIIAETGTLCLVTNEGNGRLVTSLPRIHVAIVGIEKIVASLEDYATLTQVLPRSATGQAMPVYTQMYNGPRSSGETDGPDALYVILVDNGRSQIYESKYAQVLTCIRCGACMNACPVYRSTGGHAYGWVYPGPLGAVITPLLTGLENATPLPHASSLCGACKQACPVDIDLPQMLLELRADLSQRGEVEGIWKWGLKLWAIGNQSPTLFELGGRLARLVTGDHPPRRLPGPLGGWTRYRDLPPFAEKSFRRQWREKRGSQDE